jgi:thiol:disulfide interchange protein DsbA
MRAAPTPSSGPDEKMPVRLDSPPAGIQFGWFASSPERRTNVIDRRDFSALGLLSLATSPFGVAAQDRPVLGKHYVTVSPRQPTRDPKQVEVLEFFAYSCSHCFALEPVLDAWQKRLPRDVLFRRIPVAFREELVLHQKLYFALEALGLVDQLHRKVFDAIHVAHDHLGSSGEIATYMAKNGVDARRIQDAMNSFGVAGKVKQASGLVAGYGIEGTPAMGVDGRWLTAGSMAGTNVNSLAVAEYLMGLAKRGA